MLLRQQKQRPAAERRTSGADCDCDGSDAALAAEATRAARDLLSPVVFNHSLRSYAWGAALAGLDGLAFDREVLYVAAMFHDTGLPTPVDGVDFTKRSAEIARAFTDDHGVAAGPRDIADAITLHHTPGVTLDHGTEACLLSAGAGLDVFGLRTWELPDAIRARVIADYPRAGFRREFADLWRTEARRVPHGRAWFLRRYAVSDVTIRIAPFPSDARCRSRSAR
jgi:HD domain